MSEPFLPQIDGLKFAFLLWLPLAPITAICSGILAGLITARIVAGNNYYPSQEPTEQAAWWAMIFSTPALLCFLFVLPSRFPRLLEPVGRGRVAMFLLAGNAIILVSAAVLALIAIFFHGIPEGIKT